MKSLIKINKIDDLNFEFEWNGKFEKINCPDASSAHGIGEISQNGQIYDLSNLTEIKINNFFDIGANIGLSTIWAKVNFPNAKIISVEPGKEIHSFYRKNTKIFKKDIKSVNKAASIDGRKLIFYTSSIHNGSSTTVENMVFSKHDKSYSVKSIDIFDLIERKLANSNPENNMIKIDIEGGEDLIMNDKRFLNITKYFKWIMIELHGEMSKQMKQYEFLKSIFSQENIAIEIQTSKHENFKKTFGENCKIEEYKTKFDYR